MSLFAATGIILLAVDSFLNPQAGSPLRSPSQANIVDQHRAWLALGTALICLATLVFFRVARSAARIGACTYEMAGTCFIIAILPLVPLFNRFYLAKLVGNDPHEVYPDIRFDDTSLLLLTDAIMTAGHLIVPIRWCSLAATEVLAVLIYAVCAVSGTPSARDTSNQNAVTLALLVLMVAVGKRALEYHERQAFLAVIEDRQGARIARNESAADAASDVAPQQAAQPAVKDSSTSDTSFNLSDTLSSSARMKDIGVQAAGFPVEHRDASTATPVVWADGDLRCGKCAKPPRPSPPPPPEVLREQFCRACRARLRNSRRADASDSSASSREGVARSGTAVNPNFALTPSRTKEFMLTLLMLQCNIVVPPQACCAFHASVLDLYTHIKIMNDRPCRVRPWVPADSQCAQCFLMIETDEDTYLCDHCMNLTSDEEGSETNGDAISV